MSSLTERQREIVNLYMQNFNSHEISAKVGLKAGTVRAYLTNARHKDKTIPTKRSKYEVFPARNPLLTQRRQMVYDLFMSGKKYREIAKVMGISPKAVSSHLVAIRKKVELPSRVNNGFVREVTTENVVSLRRQGYTYKDIAKKMNSTVSMVYQYGKGTPRGLNRRQAKTLRNMATIAPRNVLDGYIVVKYVEPPNN